MVRYTGYQKNNGFAEKTHEMSLDKYKNAKLVLKSPDEELLYEAVFTYINTLSYNACWDFEHKESFENGLYSSEVCFKWNGCIGAVDACAKLQFHNLQIEWKLKECYEE